MLVVFMVLIYGIYSENRLHTSWNITVKVIFDLPRETHQFFIEPMTENIHLKAILCTS